MRSGWRSGRALPGGAAEPGSEVLTGPVRVTFAALPVLADGDVQPEPAGARGPQLLPPALRHPGHLDLRTHVPPGPAPPCPGTGTTVVRSSTDESRELIRSSLPIPIGFIMTIRRLVRVSWPCRSRYATSAAQSRPSARGRRPGGAPPAGPGRLSRPPRRCPPGGDRRPEQQVQVAGGVQRTWIGATLPVRLEQMFEDPQGDRPFGARMTRRLWPMAAEPGPDFRWGALLRASKPKPSVSTSGEAVGAAESLS
jgi:hypothetical protein